MGNLPTSVAISEEGPREGFQIERGPIPTERKIELVDTLSQTGLKKIQIVSFVNAARVPGMADAEQVVAGYNRRLGIAFTGIWLNGRGLQRAIATQRLDIEPMLHLSASDAFLAQNQNRTFDDDVRQQHLYIEEYQRNSLALQWGAVMAAFGCNFQGDIAPGHVVSVVETLFRIAGEHGETLSRLSLADTMAWATPLSIKRVVGAVRDRWPDVPISLHLHDTRGMGLALAWAGIELGINQFDTAVAGLGGCPFAGHAGAAGNICTEDLVLMCEEMGIATGVDLDRLIVAARLAEDIVGHPLPGAVKRTGSLRALREKISLGRNA